MSHKFAVRQLVRLKQPSISDKRVTGGSTYEVVRLMPEDQTGEPAYRIRSGDSERAVRESEIASA
ncbi:hypothetical protein [Microvirga pudoricolor]|uniref:hypothetical protein n=1 Tax=Microvirga pudoricolor TaxID=2778729 RepID=UPI00194DC141|nr:hypothetical protein [Microvirga pudoricolor]MBM6595596.1 hypothetical protein [Microvirga pudoricolor]